MRTKVTLVLIFLNVVLFYYIFFVHVSFKPVDNVGRILGPGVANIQTLAITDEKQDTLIRIERHGDKWLLTTPIVWPANEFAVRGIINELLYLRPDATFPVENLPNTNQSLADFGLEKPRLTLSFTPAAVPGSPAPAPVVIGIGDSSGVGNRLYILSPDGKQIHVVPRSLAENLTRTLTSIRSDEIFTIPVFEATSLNLEPANGSRIRFRRDNDRWSIEGLSVTQARASKVKTELALTDLRDLRVNSFVPSAESEPIRAALKTPALRITIEGTNRRETLLLGAPVPNAPTVATATPPADGAPPSTEAKPSTLHYAVMESIDSSDTASSGATVFTVYVPDKFFKDTLLNAARELRERQILDLDFSTLSSLTLASPQSPQEIVLQRLEAPAASAWQIVRRSPDRAPEPEPADRAIVEQLISDLAHLSAEDPADNEDHPSSAFIDAPSEAQKEEFGFNRPARTITFTTSGTQTPATVRLLIGTSHDRHTYAKLANQEYIYRVSDEILNQIPVDPLVYRQRLLRELPANITITALKLTDLANDAILLDTTLPLAADSPLKPAVIESLVAQLRTLRAKKFTAGEQRKTVFIAGEERPWKYRLDATLTTAGAEARATVSKLYFSERAGGDIQLAGSPEFNVVFEVEQPLLDALFALTYGPHDPGPPPETEPQSTATPPPASTDTPAPAPASESTAVPASTPVSPPAQSTEPTPAPDTAAVKEPVTP